MLKPNELKEKEFELSVLGGYKREDVDAFFAEVTSNYEKIFEENAELVQKLKVCVSKIEDYQKDEQFLKSAIINAEKLNENTLKKIEEREKAVEQTAKEKADSIIAQAKSEAENIVESARADAAESIKKCEIETARKIAELKGEIYTEQEKLERMKKEVSDFKEGVFKLYKQHVDVMSKLPDYTPDSKPAIIEKEVYSVPVEDEPKIEEPGDTFVEEQPIENEVVEEEPVDLSDVNVDDKTAEFIINKKNVKKNEELQSESFEQNFKFKSLKFGTDFDVKSDT